ncbi:hypothetical protein D3C83_64640 [compost metagenome]
MRTILISHCATLRFGASACQARSASGTPACSTSGIPCNASIGTYGTSEAGEPPTAPVPADASARRDPSDDCNAVSIPMLDAIGSTRSTRRPIRLS